MKDYNAKIEASIEFQQFIERVKKHNLRSILSAQALTLMFLALGSKMWEEK